jgi:iron complex transport system permease protein
MNPLTLNLSLAATALLAALAGLFSGLDGGVAALGPALRGEEDLAAIILAEIRAPRVALSLLIGAGLGAAGAALQGYLRNPLADPGVIGVSPSAGLGAVAALYFGASNAFSLAVPAAAVLGAAAGTAGLLLLAGPGARATTLILAGVAIGALATALTALLMNMAPNPWALAEIAYWLMGSLNDSSWSEARLAAPLILAGLALLATTGRALDALSLGEEGAASLGIDLGRLRLVVVAGAALAVGGGVAAAGAIGFIGLVVPHLLRPFTDASPARLLLPSALGGAALLTLADLAVRHLSGPGQPLYLGVLTALIGAPFFLWLVRSTRRLAP